MSQRRFERIEFWKWVLGELFIVSSLINSQFSFYGKCKTCYNYLILTESLTIVCPNISECDNWFAIPKTGVLLCLTYDILPSLISASIIPTKELDTIFTYRSSWHVSWIPHSHSKPIHYLINDFTCLGLTLSYGLLSVSAGFRILNPNDYLFQIIFQLTFIIKYVYFQL